MAKDYSKNDFKSNRKDNVKQTAKGVGLSLIPLAIGGLAKILTSALTGKKVDSGDSF